MCTRVGLTTWDWVTYVGLVPGENGFPFSQQPLIADSSSCRDGLCEISSMCVSMSASVVLTRVLFRQLYYREFMAPVPCHVWKTLTCSGVLWLLGSFCPLVCDLPWALGIGVALWMYQLRLGTPVAYALHFDSCGSLEQPPSKAVSELGISPRRWKSSWSERSVWPPSRAGDSCQRLNRKQLGGNSAGSLIRPLDQILTHLAFTFNANFISVPDDIFYRWLPKMNVILSHVTNNKTPPPQSCGHSPCSSVLVGSLPAHAVLDTVSSFCWVYHLL